MKNVLILIAVFTMVGCNKLHKNEELEDRRLADDYTVAGVTTQTYQWVNIRVENSDILVKVLRPGENEWVSLNQYEYKKDSTGHVIFKNKVEILPSGSLRYTLPRVEVAPIGTQYEIRSISMGSNGRIL